MNTSESPRTPRGPNPGISPATTRETPPMTITLLTATTNRGKIREIQLLLRDLPCRVLGLEDLHISADCPETGASFAEIAAQKALFYNNLARPLFPDIWVAADDSGLETEALNGAPGIRSARFAGEPKNDDLNTAKLLQELAPHENRRARFVTAAALARRGAIIASFTGEVRGLIAHTPKGNGGFGYDPVFIYPPLQKTFAELSTEEKNAFSHRSAAFQQLRDFILQSLLRQPQP